MSSDDGWMVDAACRGLDNPDPIFFPRKRKGVKTDYSAAKRICADCPVRMSCLAFAIAHKIADGVWGGYSDSERKAISRDVKLQLRRKWRRLHSRREVR